MKPKNIYLTIDDSPSINTSKIVQYLKDNNMPAIFFCRGEFIETRKEDVQCMIKNGFLVGNHSYSHPYFSKIPVEQCFEELLKTEALIEQCYEEIDEQRELKIVRLPFADRGAGKWACSASTEQEQDKIIKIQNFLSEHHFKSIAADKDNCIDVFWDWDTQDYKSRYISSPQDYLRNLEAQWASIDSQCPVMLIHDFDHNFQLFEVTMKFLKQNNIICHTL